jgi:hypothetical protein
LLSFFKILDFIKDKNDLLTNIELWIFHFIILRYKEAVISKIIKVATEQSLPKDLIISMAFNHIGDPYTKGYLWKYEIEQLAIYQQFLDSAKNIINEFINSEIIEFFLVIWYLIQHGKYFGKLYKKNIIIF